jgi:hypothetical protein
MFQNFETKELPNLASKLPNHLNPKMPPKTTYKLMSGENWQKKME